MDPSTQTTSSVAEQSQVINRIQPPAAVTPPGSAPSSITPPSGIQPISGPKEQAPLHTGTAQEMPQQDSEEQIQLAKQEAGLPSVGQQKEEQQIEVKQSIPEVSVEQSVEGVIEKSPDTEKPKISEPLQKAGVTHSGPGVPIEENKFAVHTMPMTYQQAAVIDKQTPLKDSKHWLAELIMYIWRKLDPAIAKKGAVK